MHLVMSPTTLTPRENNTLDVRRFWSQWTTGRLLVRLSPIAGRRNVVTREVKSRSGAVECSCPRFKYEASAVRSLEETAERYVKSCRVKPIVCEIPKY